MKPHTMLRGVGVVGVVAAYGVYAIDGRDIQALAFVILGIVALVSPEVLDQLPFGPNKS